MTIREYLFIDETLILNVYSFYLDGLSEEEIFVKLNAKFSVKLIGDIIDYTNYLYV
jgi:hypothetical protein